MDTGNAKSHVTLVAGLHIGFGALTVLGAVITWMAFRFAWGFIPDIDDEIPMELLTALGRIIPGIIAFFGVIDILAGISLFSYKQWSRVFVIVVSVMNCLNIPIGTAKGVYSIWALSKQEVSELFE